MFLGLCDLGRGACGLIVLHHGSVPGRISRTCAASLVVEQLQENKSGYHKSGLSAGERKLEVIENDE